MINILFLVEIAPKDHMEAGLYEKELEPVRGSVTDVLAGL